MDQFISLTCCSLHTKSKLLPFEFSLKLSITKSLESLTPIESVRVQGRQANQVSLDHPHCAKQSHLQEQCVKDGKNYVRYLRGHEKYHHGQILGYLELISLADNEQTYYVCQKSRVILIPFYNKRSR